MYGRKMETLFIRNQVRDQLQRTSSSTKINIPQRAAESLASERSESCSRLIWEAHTVPVRIVRFAADVAEPIDVFSSVRRVGRVRYHLGSGV